jgi:hypothetical protein
MKIKHYLNIDLKNMYSISKKVRFLVVLLREIIIFKENGLKKMEQSRQRKMEFSVKKLLLFIVFLSSIQLSFAQGRYNGYVISNSDDTIKGIIELGSDALRTVRVTFTDYEIRTPEVLEPFQVKGYYANGQYYESKIYDIDQGLDYGYAVFMERLEDGYLNLYKYWNNRRKRFEMIVEGYSRKMTLITRKGFQKQMMETFKEYPALNAKIARNVYNINDLQAVVLDYNSWKEKNKVYQELTKKK